MSLVVGLVHGSQVYMGADSTETRAPLTLGRQTPIFRIPPLLLGFRTSSPLMSYLQYRLARCALPTRGQIEEFLRGEVVGMLREYRKDPLSAWKQAVQPAQGEPAVPRDQNGQAAQASRVLLVGGYGRLFTVWSNDRVVEALNGYDAVGAGYSAALGALYATRGLSAEERVTSALRAAERLTGTVRRPFFLVGSSSPEERVEPFGAGPYPHAV